MPVIDRQEIKDPQSIAEYSQKNFENMKNEEEEFEIPAFLRKQKF